ncbi:MAG: restriction endonuclease subunit S [Ignavibacteria bacterium]|nr:restriction endonuclease subunit S [Ignavibacteria bacterium]
MKPGWEVKKLGDVLEIQNGYAFDSKQFSNELGTPLIRIRDIKSGVRTKTNFNGQFDKKYLVESGDYLIGMDGEFGCYEWNGPNALLNQRVCRLHKFTSQLHPRFVLYGINKYLKAIEDVTAFTTVKHISSTQILKIEIPLPPLPEQQRIVAILDQVFAAIAKAKANAEQNLKNAKELFESYLQGVFEKKGEGWERIRLGDVCKINDGTHHSPKNTAEGQFMYITAKNIKPYHIDLTKISYLTEADHRAIFARCAPVKGDVLYIKDGATAGIAAVNTLDEEFSLLSSVALLKCSAKVLNTFLVHYMNSTIGKKNFMGYIDGAAITRITLIKMKDVCFSIPSFTTQQTIVRDLEMLAAETSKLEGIYKSKLSDLEELKKSILQKAFAGELGSKIIEVS